jgi:hypothetical protein
VSLPPLRPGRSAVVASALLACPAAAPAADQPPHANFSFTPEDPLTGQEVRFDSSSCDPGGRPIREAWDLDGDGAFDVRISKGRSIGKYTQFRTRRGSSPSRRDRCLRPGERKGSTCPRD